jgi:hypothetical protein
MAPNPRRFTVVSPPRVRKPHVGIGWKDRRSVAFVGIPNKVEEQMRGRRFGARVQAAFRLASEMGQKQLARQLQTQPARVAGKACRGPGCIEPFGDENSNRVSLSAVEFAHRDRTRARLGDESDPRLVSSLAHCILISPEINQTDSSQSDVTFAPGESGNPAGYNGPTRRRNHAIFDEISGLTFGDLAWPACFGCPDAARSSPCRPFATRDIHRGQTRKLDIPRGEHTTKRVEPFAHLVAKGGKALVHRAAQSVQALVGRVVKSIKALVHRAAQSVQALVHQRGNAAKPACHSESSGADIKELLRLNWRVPSRVSPRSRA